MKRAEVCKRPCGTYSDCETKKCIAGPNNGHQRPAERSMGESLHGFKRFLIYTNIYNEYIYIYSTARMGTSIVAGLRPSL